MLNSQRASIVQPIHGFSFFLSLQIPFEYEYGRFLCTHDTNKCIHGTMEHRQWSVRSACECECVRAWMYDTCDVICLLYPRRTPIFNVFVRKHNTHTHAHMLTCGNSNNSHRRRSSGIGKSIECVRVRPQTVHCLPRHLV